MEESNYSSLTPDWSVKYPDAQDCRLSNLMEILPKIDDIATFGQGQVNT